ncbi:7-alpha-cephem-methoxylase [Streptomyces sp. CB02923]|uniref:CmcJ/NvfI family oxidoreductase n=1 Tax=Streptomyces sp. CB02923 TaxID=1718985 RepID=UPI00093A705A|nr:CmcJ/NvfI family oxidoreductase [Streptomyces sp. CB02923]OKI04829.1 7-alpha-cephem-methoxylase [Streptomyces sp. CB02923]
MSAVSSLLYYGAPLTPMGRDDDWCIDALSRPPEVLFNFRKVAVETAITDVRDSAVDPHLDTMGFEKVVSPTGVDHQALIENSASSVERYQQETRELLQSLTGAVEVQFFDATLRQEDASVPRDASSQSPHLRVHVDQSAKSARARAADHIGPGHRFRRFQIINIWRPLVEPVRNFPLALCDYRSVDLSADLVTTRLHFPAWLKDRENYSVRYNPNHRWHYWSSLSPDEVLLFKCYDSASRDLALFSEGTERGEGAERSDLLDVAGLCPHTAFFDEKGPAAGHLRTSLEMRALVFL